MNFKSLFYFNNRRNAFIQLLLIKLQNEIKTIKHSQFK